MTDPARSRDAKRHVTPRWVKVFAVIAGVLVVLVVILLLTGHGPSRHMGFGGGGRQAPAVQSRA
jgi:hypothetical protein